MRAGADVVYQACFVDGEWRGLADFVERQADGCYEAVDTKLARHGKPAHMLQLCFYSEQIERIQGRDARADARRARLGRARELPRRRLPRLLPPRPRAVPRRGRGRDRRLPAARSRSASSATSRALRRVVGGDDHLVRVARHAARPDRAARRRGITTLERARRRAATTPGRPRWRRATFEKLRDQAALQLAARRERARVRAARRPSRARVRAAAAAAPGDLFFDIEGDPFWEPDRGLEYLLGIVDTAGAFRPFWAHDRARSGARSRARSTWSASAARHPALHVYHYASYEPTALKRLTCEYGTREEELDDLLRARGLRRPLQGRPQGLRISHPRYWLKNVEQFYIEREAELRAGDDSIVLYEQWLERARPGDPRRDRGVQRGGLRLDLAAARLAAASGRAGAASPRSRSRASRRDGRGRDRGAARRRCSPGCPTICTSVAEDDRPRWLLAQLLDYHRREAKPDWWAFFDRLGRTTEELLEPTPRRSAGSSRRAADAARESRSSAVHASRPSSTSSAPATPSRPGDRQAAGHDRRARRRGRDAARCAAARRSRTCRCRGADPRRPVHDAEQQEALLRLAPLGARRRRPLPARSRAILVREPSPAALRRTTSTR